MWFTTWAPVNSLFGALLVIPIRGSLDISRDIVPLQLVTNAVVNVCVVKLFSSHNDFSVLQPREAQHTITTV